MPEEGDAMEIGHDHGLSDLLRSDAETRLCGGFQFTEGPLWIVEDQCLLFSDIPNNRIHRWRPGHDTAEIYREPSRYANGLTRDRAGAILACEHQGRQVTRGAYDGPEEPLATTYDGKRLNSPNDIVVHSSGAIYFTDPTYGERPNMGGPGEPRELRFRGVYRIDPDGTLVLVDDSFTQPNGLCFSPDETVLYVGDSQEKVIRRFAVEGDGSLRGGELFVDMRGDARPGVPDGMKVDVDGRLWTTGAGGVWVVTPDGSRLGDFECTEHAANLTFGGPDFTTLDLTARTSVYSVETTVWGIAPGSRE
jgi:sugar lactone lactonase YvrE